LLGHNWTVTNLKNFQGKVIFTGSADGSIRVWNVHNLVAKLTNSKEVVHFDNWTVEPRMAPKLSLFEQFLMITNDRNSLETEREAKENSWKVIMKLGKESLEIKQKEMGICPLCQRYENQWICKSYWGLYWRFYGNIVAGSSKSLLQCCHESSIQSPIRSYF
jgi:hypothetical protein